MGGKAARSLRASLILVLGLALGGCGPSTRVPADAQLVHVVASDASVRVEPATVPAGDVYFVLEEATEAVVFVQRKASEQETPGPLMAEDLGRLTRGDTQFTAIQGFETSGCSPQERGAHRGELRIPGSCGNVFWVPSLAAGSYALLPSDASGNPTGTSVPMAVLEIVP